MGLEIWRAFASIFFGARMAVVSSPASIFHLFQQLSPTKQQKWRLMPPSITMKTTKRSKSFHGGSEQSILSFFSTAKRTNPKSQAPLSFGTPATPVVAQLVDVDAVNDNGVGTPASVVSDDTVLSEPSAESTRTHINLPSTEFVKDRRTWAKSACNNSSALDEPKTPPSPTVESLAPDNDIKSIIAHVKTIGTPPSNDSDVTTPRSPPTPDNDKWMDIVIDKAMIDVTNRKRSHPYNMESLSRPKETHSVRDSSKIQNDQAIISPQQRQDHLNMGTPATSDTPSTTASSDPRQSHNFFRKYAPSTMSSIKFSKNILPSKTFKSAKKQKPSNQLFLDFGQNSFGKQTICDICGMLRVHGLDEDDAQHAKICEDYKQGVPCLGWKNERMVGSFGKDDRIVEVRSDDAQQHVGKVLEVKDIVDKELGFANRQNGDSSSSHLDNMTCYMYISKKRVVGLLLVKRIQRGYEFLLSKQSDKTTRDNSSSISRSLKPSKALLGIHQIWVHKSHRHRGIASHLVTAARDHLIFGMVVPVELIAFSSPTEEGLKFAQSYVGSERPLIYDIR
jgi:N-acetyltransferase